jgi:hypothetical protein
MDNNFNSWQNIEIERNDLDSWLSLANIRYRQEEIHPKGRPFRALSEFTQEFNCSISLNSPIAKTIFDWFTENSQPGSHAIGSLFTGAFYFDTCFWPLSIPIGYGTFALSPYDSLETMPQLLQNQVNESSDDCWRLNLYWIDCCDYAYGVDDIQKQGKLNPKALTFIQNADRELVGAVSQLLIPRPNTKAILALRMASEIFMKAILIQEKNLTDQQLKRNFSHKIEDIADECFAITGIPEFKTVFDNIGVFPANVSDRYDGGEWKLSDVWKAVYITQIAATAVTRFYTSRDIRPQIFGTVN